jgi:hypothetical protein
MNAFLSNLFPKSDDPNDQNVHVWVAAILLLLVLSIVLIKRGLGKRAL